MKKLEDLLTDVTFTRLRKKMGSKYIANRLIPQLRSIENQNRKTDFALSQYMYNKVKSQDKIIEHQRKIIVNLQKEKDEIKKYLQDSVNYQKESSEHFTKTLIKNAQVKQLRIMP